MEIYLNFSILLINGLIEFIKCERIAIVADIPKVLDLFPVNEPINNDKHPKKRPSNDK
tara:strand:+ start:470 stop:643 length:174 start_codon:yes stop_codon:yes gene_type:complete